jgi:transcriptional regulator with XRE-family HTH domain
MEEPTRYGEMFRELGNRYRRLRTQRGLVQEDAMEYGFSVRHYQQLEAGRPHNLKTLFRLAQMLGVSPENLIKGLGAGRLKPKKKPR